MCIIGLANTSMRKWKSMYSCENKLLQYYLFLFIIVMSSGLFPQAFEELYVISLIYVKAQISVSGKSRKSLHHSRVSSGYDCGGVKSTDYPTLPMTHSTEALQQQAKKERKFPKTFLPRPIKSFNLRSLSLKKGSKAVQTSHIPVSRSCEELDGSQETPESWKRSHSLGDIHWEQAFDQRKDQRGSEDRGRPERKKNTVNTDPVESKQDQSSLQRPMVPTQLPLSLVSQLPAAQISYRQPVSAPTSPAPRTHPKKPPVPPPVPAKKSKERLPNGLRHPPLVLSGSVPNTPTLPPKPIYTPTTPSESSPVSPGESPAALSPPWLSDLPESACRQIHGAKVALSRKISHAKMVDLETLLEDRMRSEGIDLTEEPYSDKVSNAVFTFRNLKMPNGTLYDRVPQILSWKAKKSSSNLTQRISVVF